MPKSQQHWLYDLVTVLLVVGVAGLVFWLVPIPAEARLALWADSN